MCVYRFLQLLINGKCSRCKRQGCSEWIMNLKSLLYLLRAKDLLPSLLFCVKGTSQM